MSNWVRRCYECNWPLGQKDIFCPRCGARQRPERARSGTGTRRARGGQR